MSVVKYEFCEERKSGNVNCDTRIECIRGEEVRWTGIIGVLNCGMSRVNVAIWVN
jgi:hypothetical protein